jgi:hypothetical protein
MIEKIIAQKLQQYHISEGDNLLGYEIDIDTYFEDSGMFEGIDVRRTGDPRCALYATCTTTDSNPSEQAIEAELERIWLTRLGYRHWKKHEFETTSETISLRFVTINQEEPWALCVTGIIVVRRRS